MIVSVLLCKPYGINRRLLRVHFYSDFENHPLKHLIKPHKHGDVAVVTCATTLLSWK